MERTYAHTPFIKSTLRGVALFLFIVGIGWLTSFGVRAFSVDNGLFIHDQTSPCVTESWAKSLMRSITHQAVMLSATSISGCVGNDQPYSPYVYKLVQGETYTFVYVITLHRTTEPNCQLMSYPTFIERYRVSLPSSHYPMNDVVHIPIAPIYPCAILFGVHDLDPLIPVVESPD